MPTSTNRQTAVKQSVRRLQPTQEPQTVPKVFHTDPDAGRNPRPIFQPSEPVLFPKIRTHLADFPNRLFPKTRDYSSWRPDAVLGTANQEDETAWLTPHQTERNVSRTVIRTPDLSNKKDRFFQLDSRPSQSNSTPVDRKLPSVSLQHGQPRHACRQALIIVTKKRKLLPDLIPV